MGTAEERVLCLRGANMSCTPNGKYHIKGRGVTYGWYAIHLYRGKKRCIRCGIKKGL